MDESIPTSGGSLEAGRPCRGRFLQKHGLERQVGEGEEFNGVQDV